MHVRGSTGRRRKLPTDRMRVKIVPYAREVHIENIPAQLLSCVAFYCRSVTDERTAVQTEIRGTATAGKYNVVMIPHILPVHSPTGRNRNHLRVEQVVLDAYVL